MKRILTCLLALALVLPLAACGAQSGGTQPQSAAASAAQGADDAQSAAGPEDNGPNEEFTVLETDAAARVSDLTVTAMATDKKFYARGEAVTLTLDWAGTPDETCWIGIVPADIRHGDEEINDEADLTYLYLGGAEPGDFTFTYMLEPGSYTFRANEPDSGGAELAWTASTVKK